MRVAEVEIQEAQRRYVVIDEDGKLIGLIVRYLKYLDRIGSARQTQLLSDCIGSFCLSKSLVGSISRSMTSHNLSPG
jgi:hypothetical protein